MYHVIRHVKLAFDLNMKKLFILWKRVQKCLRLQTLLIFNYCFVHGLWQTGENPCTWLPLYTFCKQRAWGGYSFVTKEIQSSVWLHLLCCVGSIISLFALYCRSRLLLQLNVPSFTSWAFSVLFCCFSIPDPLAPPIWLFPTHSMLIARSNQPCRIESEYVLGCVANGSSVVVFHLSPIISPENEMCQ